MAKECRKKKFHEDQQKKKRHSGHFSNDDYVEDFRLFMSDLGEKVDVDTWYVDSGASTHMMGNIQCIKEFKEINNEAQIYLGDDKSHQIKGCGEISELIAPGPDIPRLGNQFDFREDVIVFNGQEQRRLCGELRRSAENCR